MTHLLGLVGVFALSFSAVFFHLAHVSPATAAFFRAVYATPLLLVLYAGAQAAAPGPRTGPLGFIGHLDQRRAIGRMMAAGSGVLLALDLVLWHAGIELVGAGLATVAASIQVVLVAAAGWVRHGERPAPFAATVIAVVLTGIVMTSGLSGDTAYGAAPVTGIAVSVLAGVSYAGFLIVFRDAARHGSHPIGALLDATLGMGLGALACAPFDHGFSLVPTWPAHGWLAALAVVTQIVGWLCIAGALPRLPALETSILLVGQPVLSVVWGVWLFGERLSGLQWTGAALVLVGVAALSARSAVQPRMERTANEGR